MARVIAGPGHAGSGHRTAASTSPRRGQACRRRPPARGGHDPDDSSPVLAGHRRKATCGAFRQIIRSNSARDDTPPPSVRC